MAKKIRQPKTYALYKKDIYSWVDLLLEFGLEHNDNANARPEFYKQASSKQLKAVKCMIKDDDEKYVEICKECGELIDDCVCGIKPPKNNNINKNYISSNESENENGNRNKKIVTRAKLPNGEVIQWTELLRRYNLPHKYRAAASVEWIKYKNNDRNTKKLPDVEVVSLDGSYVPDKEGRPVITPSDKRIVWTTYFPNTLKGICPCCKGIKDNEINFGWFIIGHNTPVSKGGSSEPDNLVPICGECNQGMGNKYSIVQWRKRLLSIKRKKIV